MYLKFKHVTQHDGIVAYIHPLNTHPPFAAHITTNPNHFDSATFLFLPRSQEFYCRYRMLVRKTKLKAKNYPLHLHNDTQAVAKKKCEELVRLVLTPLIDKVKGLNPDTIQFGKTKVFLRKNAYDILEILRSHSLVEVSIIIQASARVRTRL